MYTFVWSIHALLRPQRKVIVGVPTNQTKTKLSLSTVFKRQALRIVKNEVSKIPFDFDIATASSAVITERSITRNWISRCCCRLPLDHSVQRILGPTVFQREWNCETPVCIFRNISIWWVMGWGILTFLFAAFRIMIYVTIECQCIETNNKKIKKPFSFGKASDLGYVHKCHYVFFFFCFKYFLSFTTLLAICFPPSC